MGFLKTVWEHKLIISQSYDFWVILTIKKPIEILYGLRLQFARKSLLSHFQMLAPMKYVRQTVKQVTSTITKSHMTFRKEAH